MQTVAELAVGVADDDWQERCVELLSPFRDQLGVTASGSLCYGLVATTLGQLSLALGRVDEAVDLLREAVARAENMGAPYESVRARRLLASALLAGGHRAEAGGLILEAGADARNHGFDGEAAILAALAGGES